MELIETVQAAFSNAKIDKSGRVLRNVVLLRPFSANNREYSEEALLDAATFVRDGVKAFINHPDARTTVRDIRDLLGAFTSPRLEDGILRGDLYYLSNQKDLVEAIAEQPMVCGFSINAAGKVHQDKSGKTIVDNLTGFNSIDLVSTPASLGGIHEGLIGSGVRRTIAADERDEIRQQFDELCDIMKINDDEDVEKVKREFADFDDLFR